MIAAVSYLLSAMSESYLLPAISKAVHVVCW